METDTQVLDETFTVPETVSGKYEPGASSSATMPSSVNTATVIIPD